jgi:hypothetical protein
MEMIDSRERRAGGGIFRDPGRMFKNRPDHAKKFPLAEIVQFSHAEFFWRVIHNDCLTIAPLSSKAI